MRGLLIKSPFIDEILNGRKTWEIRGSNTKIRGRIALIRSGSGLIVGTCSLVDVAGPLTLRQMLANQKKHRMSRWDLAGGLPYEKTYAWVLADARRFPAEIPYRHPSGAVIWVNLDDHPQRAFLETY